MPNPSLSKSPGNTPMHSHGGKREGAGRPPSPNAKVTYANKLDQKVVEYLRQSGNAASIIETLIKRSAKFREWVKVRKS